MADLTTLDLEPPQTVQYRRMRWTQDGDAFRCGSIVIQKFRPNPERAGEFWGTFLDGQMICRRYGYQSAKDAMFAAPHLGPIKKMRLELSISGKEESDGQDAS